MIDLHPQVGAFYSNVQHLLIVEIVQNRVALESQAIDYEKPGLAQHYCVECAKSVGSRF